MPLQWRRSARWAANVATRIARCAPPIFPALILALVAAPARDARAGDARAARTAPPAPVYSSQGADTCLTCHGSDATVMAIFHTKHARPADANGPFGHGGLQCEACHGPGGAHVDAKGDTSKIIAFGPKSHSTVLQQNANCLGCHQANAAHDWASSAHAASDVACTSCHRLHAAKDPVQTSAGQIEVCAGCHQAQHADLDKLSRHPLREGKMACTSCHSPLGSTAPAQLVRNTVNETCTSCHTEYRGPFLWEHQPVTEDCSNCHDAHGSSQPALLKLRPPFLCQTCHEGAGHPSVVNSPQGLPGAGASAFLLAGGCINCHSQIHGSNHPSGRAFMR
ncbi:MAG: DmsE family decaheme c-type cytochrome [Steroidobacteraceae bacterium]